MHLRLLHLSWSALPHLSRAALLLLLVCAGCSGDDDGSSPTPDSPTPVATSTPAGTPTPVATPTPGGSTATPAPTSTPETPTPSETPPPSETPGVTPSPPPATPTLEPTPGSPTPAVTPTLEPTPPSPTPGMTPTLEPTPTPTLEPTPTPTPVPDHDLDGDGFDATAYGGEDCDDAEASTYPGATEVPYDDIDQDCTGGDLVDVDEDGQPATGAGGDDCDDDDPDVYKGAKETPYDGEDQDCSGADLTDVDGDGYASTAVSGGTDCDDGSALTHPGATELGDGVDNDCDGRIDEDLNSTDDDLDGYSEQSGDCNDYDKKVHPGALETPYDGVDQDCSGADLTDVDDDGYAATAVSGGTDCDDDDPSIHPGAIETAYDGVDQDCSGGDLVDVDGDGYAATAVSGGTDCDDSKSSIHPGATEVCDTVDNDCDGITDSDAVDLKTFYKDADGDGFGDPTKPVTACSGGSSLVQNSLDCDDSSPTTYPNAAETCNQVDDDCDGQVDEGLSTSTWYPDADKDGYGSTSGSIQRCSAPSGYVGTGGDCNDSSAGINPGAAEVCNEVDDDCNGIKDFGNFAASFDGNGDYIQMSDNDFLDMGTGDFTIQAWVRIDVGVNFQGRVYSKGSYGCTKGYMMRTTGDTRVLGELTGNCQSFAGGTYLGDGKWHQLTAVFDRDANMTLYLDGNVDGVGNIAAASASVTNANNPRIGIDDASLSEPFRGLIDEVRVWNRVLTPSEIKEHMCRPLVGNEANLMGYWPLETGYQDATGHGSDGSARGDAKLVAR